MNDVAVEIKEREPNVHEIVMSGRRFIIIGTAHVSEESISLVKRIIETEQPASVAIELCKPRFEALRAPDRWKQMDIFKILREGKTYVLLAQLLVASFQKRLGLQLGIKPGAEMMAAADAADARHIPITLADREVGITLRRVWGSMGMWTTAKVLTSLVAGIFSDEKVDASEIERLKNSDALEEALKEFSDKLPEVRATLIDERDNILAFNIRNSPGDLVVGVVGAGHVPGMLKIFSSIENIDPYLKLPQPGIFSKVMTYGIPAILVGMVIAGFFIGGGDASLEVVYRWSIVTAITAALGAALALAHPLSIIAAGISAPITTVHPFLASGWVSGLVEAWVRKPTVFDLENLSTDITTVRGFFKNRVTKVLLVVAFTNLVGSVGLFLAIKFAAEVLQR